MTNLDKQIEELITERNTFESESVALKAQVNYLLEQLSTCESWRDDWSTIDNRTSKQCLDSVKADAISEMIGAMPSAGFNSERDKNN